MTHIAFHFNVGDRFDYGCRLARKAVNQRARLLVLLPQDDLARFDQSLWQLSPISFVPHCDANASVAVQTRSPIVLTADVSSTHAADVLVNLSDAVPTNFSSFARVIEIVGSDEPSRQAARQRWRRYAAAGFQLERFDVASKGAA